MTQETNEQQQQQQRGDRLINEAIKRILLDIVVRGHGDRLIGRWSREPELQQFLEQVPYMLDRINQLHLACTRSEHLEPGHIHHHYHHYHHATRHHHRQQHNHQGLAGEEEEEDDQGDYQLQFKQTSLSDFISLIGPDLHWLVRTRDALGLTPLHKAVLFNNRPIVEYILDRYPEELAPAAWRRGANSTRAVGQTATSGGPAQSTRLIDAQDKYGRTALHYAAAHLGQAAAAKQTATAEKYYTISHLYHFLVSKGASMRVPDFRGRTAAHYVRQPQELRVKSIIHLSNKLNANYQANVLSKTLRASLNTSGERPFFDRHEMVSLAECMAGGQQHHSDNNNRESMSVSCNDLATATGEAGGEQEARITRSLSSMQEQTSEAVGIGPRGGADEERNAKNGEQLTRSTTTQPKPTITTTTTTTRIVDRSEKLTKPTCEPALSTTNRPEEIECSSSPASSSSTTTMSFERTSIDLDEALRQLRQERSRNNQILSQQDRVRLKRCLNEGVVDKINELLVEGLGNYLLQEANVSCWNQQCRRYINRVIPDKLNKLDELHELIARSQLSAVRALLQREPILARMLRPYRRASMSALHLAVHFDRRPLVRYLTESFPELVAQRDSTGATCLHWAARSLKHDRLYCWLLDQFGAQLEQVRDSRAKSAADYRQQALRLSAFAETHPTARQLQPSAGELIERNQELSDRLLSLSGSRIKLNDRVVRRQMHNRSPNEILPPSNSSSSSSSLMQLTDSVPLDVASRDDDTGEQQQQQNSDAGQPIKRPANMRVRRLVSSASTGSQPDKPSRADINQPLERRCSESATKQQQQRLRSGSECSASSSSRQSCSDNVFLGEFAELDVHGVDEGENENQTAATPTASTGTRDAFRDSPLATPTLPVVVVAGLARPESASGRQRLDSVIIDSIKAEDYKKLEHLILAGCGERLLRVYKSTFGPPDSGGIGTGGANENSGLVSAKMREFLDKSLFEYMEKIAKIYEVLHRCYGGSGCERAAEQIHRQQATAAITTNSKAARADKMAAQTTTNLMFHKLCNLLDRKRLIMSRDSYGACPLHIALIRCDARLVEYLLRRHPEAASAPDHESRTALHYAAIVLAAYNRHGPFRLTCSADQHTRPRGFWLVDEQAQLTYEKLCSRYGAELLEARDRAGLTCGQYLEPRPHHQHHQRRRASSPATGEQSPAAEGARRLLEPARVFADCCPDYAQLLARYNYCLLPSDEHSDSDACGPLRASDSPLPHRSDISNQPGDERHGQVLQPTTVLEQQQQQQQQQQQRETAQDSEGPTAQTAVESLANDDDGGQSLSSNPAANKSQASVCENNNNINNKSPRTAPPEAGAAMDRRRSGGSGRRTTRITPTAADLALNGQLIMSSSAAGQLAEPPPQSPTLRQPIRQVAPKPTVGSEHGYPLISSHGPVSLAGRGGSHHHHNRKHHSSSSSLLLGHRRRLQGESDSIGQPLIGPDPAPCSSSSVALADPRATGHQQQQQHRRRHHSSARRVHRRSNMNDSLVGKPLVGGVIVPTIIHNDKMDEIETYDIIYRQPPSSPSLPAAISQESIAGLSSSLSSVASVSSLSLSSNFSSPEKIRPIEASTKLGLTTKSDGSGCSSSSGDDDDDDERVERLSDEFESRVRREKSELRAKVDQIMNEIKMSAKSGKSSRFLASPLNLDQPDSSSSNNNNAGPGPSGSSSQRVLFATTDNRPEAARHQSLSSSGPHSCSSSGSLSVSRTTSATSSSSCSSASTTSNNSSNQSSCSPPGSFNRAPQRDSSTPKQQPTSAGQQATATVTTTTTTTTTTTNNNNNALASKNTYGQTYLHFIASRPQNASTLYKVLKHGSYLIGERDIFYRTARDVAIQFNLASNVQILDKFIIDLFVEGRTQLLRHLLNQGYSPLIHVSDPDGNDIMLILKLLKLDRMIHFLLQMADFQRWRDELHTFIRNGYSGGVSELLRKHKDLVRAKSVHARTSLHLAVLFDRVGMVEELIEADPLSVHSTDSMGRTALHYTYGLQSMANIELIRDRLLAAGAVSDARDVKMRTPKYYYIFKREIEEIKRIELELN